IDAAINFSIIIYVDLFQNQTMEHLLTLEGIYKKFKRTEVLKGVNLKVRKGEIYGLLGINGAGKTTLIRSILGLLRIDQGRILFKGNICQPKDIQKNFGFLPENFLPPKNLKGIEFLRILGSGFNLKLADIKSLLELVGLTKHSRKYIGAYSRGMIQRLGLATCLLKDPEVIILDEPTLGLDPLGQKQVLNIIADLNRRGKTVFFSSHILSQVEQLKARIAVINSGTIAFESGVDEILKKHKASSLEEAFLKEVEGQK
ncbi:MAG: ABC transporter ATP-binding protein, partial [Candidatus Omnitrophica bacterium]|nr:ABC transporter ATP-binding protein [Candidatus Omnitrophota bacterium]